MIKLIANKKVDVFFHWFLFLGFTAYSFYLAYKRYINFEFGKFDLGNMSQIVWNTLDGRFFEVTDQFGTNISRIGMSHFDPILLIFVPIFAVFAHPMILVLAQHLLIFSAIFPIFYLSKMFTSSRLLSFMVVLIYLVYPAVGFLVVWTEFHGISFVSPLIIWLIFFLEKTNYLKKLTPKLIAIYSIFLLLLLSGKEEIGSMMALFSVFLFFKNRKLGIATFLVSSIWFLFAFFIIIPSYQPQRDSSVESFLNFIEKNNPNLKDVQADNFFFNRYSYLGKNYKEMVINLFTSPDLLKENIEIDKIQKTNELIFGPFLYSSLISPFTYFGIPDFAIGILSSDEIYTISNHRISFIVSLLMIGFIFQLKFLLSKNRLRSLAYLFVFGALISSLIFSIKSKNPLYATIFSKIGVEKVFAQKGELVEEYGKTRDADQTENTLFCLNYVNNYLQEKNPKKYSGPDYLGAHMSLRPTNAIFPAASEQSDIFVADFLEDKVYEPLNTSTSWPENKNTLKKVLDMKRHNHIFSCDRMIVFEKQEQVNEKEKSEIVQSSTIDSNNVFLIEMKKKKVYFSLIKKPDQNDSTVEYAIRRAKNTDVLDKLAFWKFVDERGKTHEFIDYAPFTLNTDLNDVSNEDFLKITSDFDWLNRFISGPVKVYFGFGSSLDSTEIFLGTWEFSR